MIRIKAKVSHNIEKKTNKMGRNKNNSTFIIHFNVKIAT